jgi:hypothetical protein
VVQFVSIGNILVNPESVELVTQRSNGLITFQFRDGKIVDVDATAAPDPNDLIEVRTALQETGLAYFVLIDNRLVNPFHVSFISGFSSGTSITFNSGREFLLPQLPPAIIQPLLDERNNGSVVNKVEGFSLAVEISNYSTSPDSTALFTSSSLYSGIIPSGITFTSGEVSGFESGRWLIVPGLKYTSSQANSFPRISCLLDNQSDHGVFRLNYPRANESTYGSFSFVQNLNSSSKIKITYGAENSTPATLVARCSFVKLSDKAPLISNPNSAVTVGGIVVTINGVPLVI